MRLTLPATAAAAASLCHFNHLHPLTYPVYQLSSDETIQVDGRLDEAAWEKVSAFFNFKF